MAGSAFQNTQHPGKAVRVEKRRGRRRRAGKGHPQRQRLRDDVRRTENSSGDDYFARRQTPQSEAFGLHRRRGKQQDLPLNAREIPQ